MSFLAYNRNNMLSEEKKTVILTRTINNESPDTNKLRLNQLIIHAEHVSNDSFCQCNKSDCRMWLCVLNLVKFWKFAKCPSCYATFVNLAQLISFCIIPYTKKPCIHFYAKVTFPAISQGSVAKMRYGKSDFNYRFSVDDSIKFNYCDYCFKNYFSNCRLVLLVS